MGAGWTETERGGRNALVSLIVSPGATTPKLLVRRACGIAEWRYAVESRAAVELNLPLVSECFRLVDERVAEGFLDSRMSSPSSIFCRKYGDYSS